KAASLPGVKAVLTGRDLPIPFGILPVSQDEHALALDKVRFVGDPVAGVAAASEEIATAALDLIEVRYESLRPITDAEDAIAHPEPRIHDYGDGGNLHKLVTSSSVTSPRASPRRIWCGKICCSSRAAPTCRWSSTRRSPTGPRSPTGSSPCG